MKTKNYRLTHKLSTFQTKKLHALYQLEWWSKGRRLKDVGKLLKNCDMVFAFSQPRTGELLAFARVITDFIYKALIFDVIVGRQCRSRGLGKALMKSILNHPRLKRVEHIELYCLPELVPFYKGLGFTDRLGKLRFMRFKQNRN